MSQDRNRYGLPRHIPEDVKREVRRRCGFGCVVCGNALVDYEHLEPEFSDAEGHVAAGIVLLCPLCHAQKTRGQWSAEKIKEAAANPKAMKDGLVTNTLDMGATWPVVRLGCTEWHETRSILCDDETVILGVLPPECSGAPYRINAEFFSATGETLLRIVENHVQINSGADDVTLKGPLLRIQHGGGAFDLKMTITPRAAITIETLQVHTPHGTVSLSNDAVTISFQATDSPVVLKGRKIIGRQCDVGLHIHSVNPQQRVGRYLSMATGAGPGAGISSEGLEFANLDVGLFVRLALRSSEAGKPPEGQGGWELFDVEIDPDTRIASLRRCQDQKVLFQNRLGDMEYELFTSRKGPVEVACLRWPHLLAEEPIYDFPLCRFPEPATPPQA